MKNTMKSATTRTKHHIPRRILALQSQNTRKRKGDKSEKNFSLCKFVRERTNLCDAQKGVREWRIKDENSNETNN